VVSSFLDPNFGIDIFPPDEKPVVLKKMKNLLLAAQSVLENPLLETKSSSSTSRIQTARNLNYIYHKASNINSTEIDQTDKIEASINKYIKVVADHRENDALDFWRTHEIVFPGLALLAKKYLSVQASSAAVERMFSIAGHIFSVKRRRLGVRFFSLLLILKLNENLIE
jgi:hypothetical protein